MERLSEFFGRLHPVLLHFPIALLWAGGVTEFARARRESAFAARAAVWLLGTGAILAVGATASGWVLALHEKVRSDERATLELHRWFGVATAAFSLVAWWVVSAWRETASPVRVWVRRCIVLTTLALVTAAGHLGAVIVWGRDWFSFGSS